MKSTVALLLLFLVTSSLCSQTLTDEERKLYNLIMEYRKENGLPSIPVSPSLTLVAQVHVKDLEINNPAQGNCNMHSWSSQGKWSSCCYTGDHARAQCMWDKPRELTSYKGYGYEIASGAAGFSNNAQSALNSWKSSSGHNAVILNQGIWKDTWQAIGIGIFGGYAVVWFGKEKDE